MPEKFVIHLTGVSCSGKSTLMAALGEQLPGIYMLAFDKLKWQIAGYHRDKHSDLVLKLEHGLLEVLCKQSISMVMDIFFENEQTYNACKALAESYGYTFVSVKLTAPKEVLITRFRDRIKQSKLMGTRVSQTDEGIFLKNLNRPAFVPQGTPLFDTFIETTEAIADKVMALLQ